MADIEVELSGSGEIGEVISWSVKETASPVNAANPRGEVGGIEIEAQARPDSKFIVDNQVVLEHSTLGTTLGLVDRVEPVTPTVVSFDAGSVLNALNIDVTAPATGSMLLSDVFTFYVSLAGNGIPVVWNASTNPTRVYGGWEGNLWDNLKVLCAVNRVQLRASGGNMEVTDLGITELGITDDISPSVQLSTEASGLSVDFVNQNTVLVSQVGGTKFNYDANPSLESNSTGWVGSVNNLTASQGRVSNNPYSGTYSYESEVTVAPVSGAVSPYQRIVKTIDVSSIQAGLPLSGSIALRRQWLVADNSNFYTTISIQFNNVDDSRVLILSTPRHGSGTFSYQNFPYSFSSKPAGATSLTVTITQSGRILLGDQLNADASLLTNGALVPYFDGNSPGATWTGTTNNSISQIVTGQNLDFYNARQDDRLLRINTLEKSVTTVATNHFPNYLAQPTPTNTLPQGVGTYYVSDSNNSAVSPTDWVLYGGSLTVAIGRIQGSIDITLVGPSLPIPGYTAPYYIGYYDGADPIPALSVAGTGVQTFPATVKIATGADPLKTSNETASTVNSQFITDLATLYSAAAWVIVDSAGPVQTLQLGLGAHQIEGFGLTPGALIRYDEAIYRVVDCDISGALVRITANWYTTAEEFDALWADSDASVFEEFWEGYDAQDVKIAPLRFYNTASGGSWLFPSTELFPFDTLFPGFYESGSLLPLGEQIFNTVQNPTPTSTSGYGTGASPSFLLGDFYLSSYFRATAQVPYSGTGPRYGSSASNLIDVTGMDSIWPSAVIRTNMSGGLYEMRVMFYDNTGTLISTVSQPQFGVNAGIDFDMQAPPNGAPSIVQEMAVPVGAVRAVMEVLRTDSAMQIGNWIAIKNLTIRGDLPYFDGDSSATDDFVFGWAGTPDASSSVRTQMIPLP